MNIINVTIDFTKGINKLTGINLITGDYASTKMIFQFDRTDGTKVLEMKNPLGELVYVGEILNNEVVLAAVENGHNYSIFSSEGRYIYEVSLYDGDSKLTSVKGELPVAKEQVIIDGEIVEPYLPIFDELIQDINNKIEEVDSKIEEADTKIETIDDKIEEVNTAIEETNNLNIDVSDKVNKEVTITLTKKDNTTKSVKISDGLSLQFMWQGTSLGIKTDDMQDYAFVDLQGIQGVPGPQGEPFRIKKTYPSVQAMNDDFNNMNYGDYVMIASSVEVQDNAKLYTRGESQWIFITDFSGATGIKGETGATPSISIGSVTSGATPSVTRTGTDENPVLNFVLQKGDKGDTGNTGDTGATGNGISNIEKTAETPSQKDYRINYTNGGHFDYSVENGEVTQAQLDEVIAENDYLNSIIDQIVPKTTGTGTSITLDDTLQAKMNMSLNPSELEQETTTGKNKLSYPTDFTETKNGCTFTGSKGIYTATNNPSATAEFIYILQDTYTIQSGDYLHMFNDISNADISLFIGFTDDTSRFPSLSSTNRIFDLSASVGKTINKIGINIKPASSLTKLTLSPMIVNSSTVQDFEEYTGGIASPNPQYPQEIHTISGDNTIVVNGPQLFDKETITNGYYYDGNGNYTSISETYISDYIKVSSSNDYTYKVVESTSTNKRINFFDSNKNWLSQVASTNVSYSFTTPNNAKYIRISFNIAVDKNKVMINEGTIALASEPYQEQTAQVNLGDLEYSKMPNADYSDEFYRATDSDTSLISGKWYLKKNIGKVVLDGSESGQAYSDKDTTSYYCYWITAPDDIIVSQNITGMLKCNYFQESTWSDIYAKTNDTPIIALRDNKRLYFRSSETTYSNFQTWLGTHNTEVYYPLATPTYTLLNDTLQSQLDTIESMLLSYKGQTNISQINNDLPFIMTSTALKEL